MNHLQLDIALALRRLRATPGFTIFSIATLALGIGLTTVVYSAIDTLLWKPLTIRDPESVVQMTQSGRASSVMSWPDFQDLRRQQTSFESLAGSQPFGSSLTSGTASQMVAGEAVNSEYFATLEVTPLIGRLIQPADERAGAPPVVVLSESFWRRKVDRDRGVVGRTVKLAGQPFEVIGVTRGPFRGFRWNIGTSAWIPMAAAPLLNGEASGSDMLEDRNRRRVGVKGRLARRGSTTSAAAEVALIGLRLEEAFPVSDAAPTAAAAAAQRRRWSVQASADAAVERQAPLGILIVMAVCLVLLIACSNLANLALARGTSRAHDLAVRTALGATRWRLVREHLVESVLVLAAGGAGAALVIRTVMAFLPTEISLAGGLELPFEPEINRSMVAMTVGATTLSFIVCGLWPALQLTLSGAIPGLGTGAGMTRTDWRSNKRLVTLQVTGSVSLFLVAAVCLKVLAGVAFHDSGIDLDRLAVAHLDFRMNGKDEAAARRIVDGLLEGGRGEDGIEAVAVSVGLPFGVPGVAGRVTTPERPFTIRDPGRVTAVVSASPTIFQTLGIPILRGRSFDDRDIIIRSSRVAVVSQNFARAMFGTTDALERTVMVRQSGSAVSDQHVTILGVAADTDVFQIGDRDDPTIYVPLPPQYSSTVTITARTSGDPAAAVGILRSVVNRADRDLVFTSAGTGKRMLEGHYAPLRLFAAGAGALGTVALVLAMTGLFGVLSHVVARRTRELGLRMALGADRRQIVRMVLLDGVRPVVDGMALGLIAGTLGRLVIRATIPVPVALFDPVSVLIVIPLAAAAVGACYVPARRAASVDPSVALRER